MNSFTSLLTVIQNEYYVELSSFEDLARYACAIREYPRRIYFQKLNDQRIFSSSLSLANTLLIFYVHAPSSGRYISYRVTSGNEICSIVESTKDISNYAPIINVESKISSLNITSKKPTDQFHPIKIQDLGSLARLTYDPELPDEQNLTLYALPINKSWILGNLTSIEMDEVYYQFNYVELDSEPTKHFLKYQGNHGVDPEFSNSFDHGFSYLPIIKIKENYTIFGF